MLPFFSKFLTPFSSMSPLFLRLCVINFSLIFDPSLPCKWWRHMWMTLVLLNLKFVTWKTYNFLWKHALTLNNYSRLSYMIGAFMIYNLWPVHGKFGAFIIIYVQHKNIFWQFLSYFDIFLPNKNISLSSQKTNLIKCRPRKKIIFTMKQWIPPSKNERKKLL